MSCPSATLVVWTSAWLPGAAAADDVLDALQSWAELHEVVLHDVGDGNATDLVELVQLPTAGEKPASPALLLAALRRIGVVGGELVLPAAGDLRGLRGNAPFAAAALRSGEAAVLRTDQHGDLGLVPERVADGVLRWTVFGLPDGPPGDQMPIGEAEFELSGAMRAAATALVELDVARHRPGVRAEIAELVDRQPSIPWPPGTPSRALRVLQRANEVAAILQVAMSDTPGGAKSASAMRRRAEALRPLDAAVRAARQAAIAEAVRALSDHAGKC